MTEEVVKTTGLPAGVSAADLDEGQGRDGAPSAPEIVNTPPAKEEPVVTPEPKVEEPAKVEDPVVVDDKQDEAGKPEYITYGDEAADSAVELLQEAGVTAEEATAFFKEAVESGDLGKIDLAALTEKVGKAKANVILIAVKDYYGRMNAGITESVNAVYGEVGGEENWKTVHAWAKAKEAKDPTFATKVKEFNQMFDLNKTSASIAARELKALYEADAGNSALEIKQINGDNAASVELNTEKLSREDYLKQVKAAHDKNDTAEIGRLRTQRQLTRNLK